MTPTSLRYVKRPKRQYTGRGRPTRYPYDEVVGTLTNGQAVLYPTKTPVEATRVVEAMRRHLRSQGLLLGRERTSAGLLLWVERL